MNARTLTQPQTLTPAISLQGEGVSTDWARGWEVFLDGLRSANTRRAYSRAWSDFAQFVGKGPWEIGSADVRNWLNDLHKRGLSQATIAQYLAAVSAFYSFLLDEYAVLQDGREVRLATINPAGGRRLRPRVERYGKASFLGAVEIRAILGQVERSSKRGLRDYALLLGYLLTGRRNAEWRSLRWSEIEERNGAHWYRWAGKGKGRRDELPQPVVDALAAWKAYCPSSEHVFPAFSDCAKTLPNVARAGGYKGGPLSDHEVGRILKRYARLAGLDPERVHVHMLRHSAAMLRKETGSDLEEISEFLDHSGLSITQVYLHRVEGRKDNAWVTVAQLLGL